MTLQPHNRYDWTIVSKKIWPAQEDIVIYTLCLDTPTSDNESSSVFTQELTSVNEQDVGKHLTGLLEMDWAEKVKYSAEEKSQRL